MLERIADLYDRIEHAIEAMRHIRAVEFGDRYHNFENVGEEIRTIAQRNSEPAVIHSRMHLLKHSLEEDLYKLIASYLNDNGEKKTAALLYRLKRWHPWSYKYFYAILEILRSKGHDSFLRKLDNLMLKASLGLIRV